MESKKDLPQRGQKKGTKCFVLFFFCCFSKMTCRFIDTEDQQRRVQPLVFETTFAQTANGRPLFSLSRFEFDWNFLRCTGFVPIFLNFTEFYWVLLGFTGFYWVLLGFTGFYWVLPSFIGFYWVLLGFTGFYWVLPGFTGFYRVLPSFIGFYWALVGFTGF